MNTNRMSIRSLIEASFDPFITIDCEGKIMDINESLTDITGESREKLIGSNFSDYFSEPQKANEVFHEAITKGTVTNYPLTFRQQGGKLTNVLFNGTAYSDNLGNVLGAILVAREMAKQNLTKKLQIANKKLAFQNEIKEKRATELINANKELAYQNEEKEKRAAELLLTNEELVFQISEKEKWETANIELEAIGNSLKIASQYSLSLIEASHDPLLTINPEGKITDMNGATVNIIGLKRKEITGTDFFNYFTEPHKAHEVYTEIYEKGSISDSQLILRHKDGKLTDLLFNGSVYKDAKGKVQGVVVVARDVTDKKRIERELKEAKEAAEHLTEIAEIAKNKAESLTLVAENALRAKQQFLSNMSHEIRTPMNAIIGFTKVLLKTELTAKQKEFLTAIKMSGDSLIVLINDILDLAKVDAGKMTFENIPFKLSLSISAMLHLFEPKIHEKNLTLIKEYDDNIPIVLMGDPVRLHQIILNLVSNAVKFCSHGKITMSVRLLKEDEEKATIEFAVSDTGIGISAEKINTIFENFQQAYSGTSRLYGGTGLGLAIVKQLVESQGGTIHVKSKLNEGSIFSFSMDFPKTNAEAEYETDYVEKDVNIKFLKILVVEDIVLNQLLMRTILEDFGFICDIAADGQKAIDKLQMNSYDVILMDLQMPVMNGFKATEHIRTIMNSSIPIIALTADVTTVDLAKCKTAGMNDYISKPVNEKFLYNKIIGIVKKSRLLNEKTEKNKKIDDVKATKCIDLKYLNARTKSNPDLMMQMISIYLEQTPPLIRAMKLGLKDKDWNKLYSAVHKMIPSFSIMGINSNFEDMAKDVQDFASKQLESDTIPEMVHQLETICNQACKELELELNAIKDIQHEQ